MNRLRAASIILLGLYLSAAPALISRTSSIGTPVLGRYSYTYALLLAVYADGAALILWVAVKDRSRLLDLTRRPIEFLHRYPVLHALLLVTLIVLWYTIRANLIRTRFFGFGNSYAAILRALAVTLLYLWIVVVLAWRSDESFKQAAMTLTMLGISISLSYVAFSYAYALVIDRTVYGPRHQLWWEMSRLDDRYIWSLRPDLDHFQPYFPDAGGSFELSTDSQGYRNQSAEDGTRIAAIGDSFLFGYGVDDPQVWTQPFAAAIDAPVHNYGVYAYGLPQYNLLAAEHMATGAYDLVIYGIYSNDLILTTDDIFDQEAIEAGQRWLRRYRSPMQYTSYRWLSGSVALSDLLGSSSEPYKCSLFGDVSLRGQAEAIHSQLDQAIALSQQYDYDLLFTLIPDHLIVHFEQQGDCGQTVTTYRDHQQSLYQDMCQYLAERDVACYDMSDDFRSQAQSHDEPLFYEHDAHWTPEGHRVYAELVARYIEAHGMLP